MSDIKRNLSEFGERKRERGDSSIKSEIKATPEYANSRQARPGIERSMHQELEAVLALTSTNRKPDGIVTELFAMYKALSVVNRHSSTL